MRGCDVLFIVLCVLVPRIRTQGFSTYGYSETLNSNSNDVQKFLVDYSREAAEMCNRVATSEWRFATNSTEYNKRRMKEQQSLSEKFDCISWKRASQFSYRLLSDQNLKRQLVRIARKSHCGLNDQKQAELHQVITVMKDNYNNARICPYEHAVEEIFGSNHNVYSPISSDSYVPKFCDLKLEPDIMRIIETSGNVEELKYVWQAWHEKIGPPVRNTYMRYVDLVNQAAFIHGFRDAGEQMRSVYEDEDFYFTVQELWSKVAPLYKQLLTFVRRGLFLEFGEENLRRDGPIPAHLLGNMFGQNWKKIYRKIKPEPDETPDVTSELLRQGYSPLRIFQTAEEFFTSMGLPTMSPEFWRNSVLQTPNNGVHSQCTASAWNFCNNVDFRIKQCTQVALDDFINSHHEMTHLQYYMQYAQQPFPYREGPNPAFHEALAHAIGLNVGGPVHLQRIGLLPTELSTSTGNSMINIEYLLQVALDKLPFMSFSLALEKWRWHVFEKGPMQMNVRFWEMKLRYSGIVPPVNRREEHFDAGSKYHVISDQDYIKYFVATILQFQVYSELCAAANHIGPLHTCDIYKSQEAGRLLMEIMQQGASLSASDLIRKMTHGRSNKLSAEPLLEFFQPLYNWLEERNRFEPIIGWNSNMDDIELFQPLKGSSSTISVSPGLLSILASVLYMKSFTKDR